nr:hypothetical protein KPHV_78510 [Kitasatospora purpeofusca]
MGRLAGGLLTRFDDLFRSLAQRRGFREYLTGLLLPGDRNKTLTALAGAEPVTGAPTGSVTAASSRLSRGLHQYAVVYRPCIKGQSHAVGAGRLQPCRFVIGWSGAAVERTGPGCCRLNSLP